MTKRRGHLIQVCPTIRQRRDLTPGGTRRLPSDKLQRLPGGVQHMLESDSSCLCILDTGRGQDHGFHIAGQPFKRSSPRRHGTRPGKFLDQLVHLRLARDLPNRLVDLLRHHRFEILADNFLVLSEKFGIFKCPPYRLPQYLYPVFGRPGGAQRTAPRRF